jgi:uncharacterized membrane protein YagU involved in acid resistance
MNSNSHISENSKSNSTLKTILWSGLIAGLLDATAGVVVYFIFKGLNPIQVLQYIASGIFGEEAFKGGITFALIGMVLHFVIAYAFAIFFFFIFPKLELIRKNTIVTGLVYGLVIWLFMNLIILPNSNIPNSPMDFVSVIEALWHMALVGLPIVMITSKYYFKNN